MVKTYTAAALGAALLALAGCQGTLRDLGNTFQADLHPAMSQEDVRLASGAMQQALEKKSHGETVSWRNPKTGFSGAFTPERTYQTDAGRYCRDFSEELRTARDTARYALTACRNETGIWRVS